MKIFLRNLSLILAMALLVTIFNGCVSKEEGRNEKRTITDVVGDEIEIPTEVNTVVNLVPYGSQIMIALGLGDYLIGINEETIESQWIVEMYPRIKEITTYPYKASAESMLNTNADVVFVEDQQTAQEFRSKGITAITFTYYTIEEFEKNISVLGEVLGGDAEKQCNKYIDYLNGNIADVEETLKNKITDKESLYYINGNSDKGFYKTTGKGSTNCVCAELSYTEYATASIIEAPTTVVDAEAILAQNPENIIIGGRYQHVLYEEIFESPEWNKISAIENEKVFKVPMGISAWNRYGIELALMIPWTAAKVYPEHYKYDVLKETIEFYKTFTGYELSEKQANYILNGLMPNGEKEIPSR